MFDLKSSPSSGELMFVERYQEVIQELARVEHKIENQNSDGGSSTIRRTGSGRSTLQAIGSAAAAGQASPLPPQVGRCLGKEGVRGKATQTIGSSSWRWAEIQGRTLGFEELQIESWFLAVPNFPDHGGHIPTTRATPLSLSCVTNTEECECSCHHVFSWPLSCALENGLDIWTFPSM